MITGNLDPDIMAMQSYQDRNQNDAADHAVVEPEVAHEIA